MFRSIIPLSFDIFLMSIKQKCNTTDNINLRISHKKVKNIMLSLIQMNSIINKNQFNNDIKDYFPIMNGLFIN